MEPTRPEFVPDPDRTRAEMEAMQREIATDATFEDDLDVDPEAICGDADEQLRLADGDDQSRLADENAQAAGTAPIVAGVDQAFLDDRAVSAIVVSRGGRVVERVSAVVETEIPYIPGLLSFREGGAILAAFERLETDPDVALVDGSGRIHYREAGLATHVGLVLDLPTIGVAKKLLCGQPGESLERKLSEGERVEIVADDDVETAENGTVIGHAVQTRQFEGGNRYVNPLYVSPGHRVCAETAANVVLACARGYKLPEPTRRADAYADEVKDRYRDADGGDQPNRER